MMVDDNNTISPEQWLADGFAEHVVAWARECGAPQKALALLNVIAREISLSTSEGHVCSMLNDYQQISGGLDPAEMRRQLLSSGVVGTAEAPDTKPLILDEDGRLYLHRYFDYERRLAVQIMAADLLTDAVAQRTKSTLGQLFAHNHDTVDWQKIAVALALQRRLIIVSGGPGTGKTSTVVSLLICLLEQNPSCRIALAAPTGKAATRIQEAIRQRATDLPDEIKTRLPTESFTIHRLLGATPNEGQFHHHAGNPLPIDALVVDEASMLDLALAARLFDAIPPNARVILLGDKDQLAAVEVGAVFSELCADPTLSTECIARIAELTGTAPEAITPPAPLRETPLHDSVIWFTQNYRFPEHSAIGEMALAVNRGQSDVAIGILRTAPDATLRWIEDGNQPLSAIAIQSMLEGYTDFLESLRANASDRTRIFAAFNRFRILCALRQGPRGADEINRLVSRQFRQQLNHPLDRGEHSPWYPGRPVMVLRNDYLLKLFNGDIGLVLPDVTGQLMAYFPDGDNDLRAIAAVRLPQHETAFAVTVHKSQGSEFDSVAVLLPARHNRVVSRELLYTGITRSREQVSIIGSETVIRQTIASPTERRSGLIRRMKAAALLAK